MTVEDLFQQRIGAAGGLNELAETLASLLGGGYVLSGGQLMMTRAQVARLAGFRIEVRPREHPPAHFHVVGGGIDATFAVGDCQYLGGSIDRASEQLVRWWYQSARSQMISEWNRTRPSDCPVGPIVPARVRRPA